MTQIFNVQLSYYVGNKIGFKAKNSRGHWADFKFVCAAAGRMDIYKRFAALDEKTGYGLGIGTIRRMTHSMRVGRVDGVEAYVAKCEGPQPQETRARQVARRHAQRVRSARGESTITRAARNAALDPPDPFAPDDGA